MPKMRHPYQRQPIVLAAIAVLALVNSCFYPPYEGDVAALVDRQGVWQYLKVYSIYQDRLPKSSGSMTPEDMFDIINDTLHGVRYTTYRDVCEEGGDTEPVVFDDTVALTPSTVYFYLPEFSSSALEVFNRNRRALSHYPNIIIDVRYNRGGKLNVTDSILGEFLPNGTGYIHSRERRYNRAGLIGETVEADKKTSIIGSNLVNKKIAVLMNEYSASASEILAAGLKDGAPGTLLIGGRSYGKGIGQVIIQQEDPCSLLSITFMEIRGLTKRTGQYHRVGIEPDTVPPEVKSKVDDYVSSSRIQAVIQEIIDERVAEDPKFSASDIPKYKERLVREISEEYYALKLLEPGYEFPDDGGDVEVGGLGKLRTVRGKVLVEGKLRNMKRIGRNWRPAGDVIVDAKDLPDVESFSDR